MRKLNQLPRFVIPLLPALLIIGCGTDQGPSLLVQKDVNGTYTMTSNGGDKDPVLFTADLSSGGPVAPSGPNYYSVVSGSITPGAGLNLGDCSGNSVNLAGRITNPDGLQVYINATGPTSDGGTLTLSGTLGTYIQGKQRIPLGSTFAGTVQIEGGSCSLPPTGYVAYH